jgi:glycyl-tRNA synthetase alpha chain
MDLILPAYDYCLKCSHTFNLLDSRGAISVTERVGLIARVRQLACEVARRYLANREEMGFPLLAAPKAAQPAQAD